MSDVKPRAFRPDEIDFMRETQRTTTERNALNYVTKRWLATLAERDKALAEARAALESMVGRFGGSSTCQLDTNAIRDARAALRPAEGGGE